MFLTSPNVTFECLSSKSDALTTTLTLRWGKETYAVTLNRGLSHGEEKIRSAFLDLLEQIRSEGKAPAQARYRRIHPALHRRGCRSAHAAENQPALAL